MPPAEPMKIRARRTRRDALYSNAACLLCGEREPLKLRRSSVADAVSVASHEPAESLRRRLWIVLAEHHLLGRAVAPGVTIPLCANCHQQLHEALRDRGVDFRSNPSPDAVENAERDLRILGHLFHELAPVLIARADQLSARRGTGT